MVKASPVPLLSSLSTSTPASALTLTSIAASASTSPLLSSSTPALISSQSFPAVSTISAPHLHRSQSHVHPHSDPKTGKWDFKRAIRESHATAYNPDDEDDDEDMRLVELLRRQHFSDSSTDVTDVTEVANCRSESEQDHGRKNAVKPYGPYCDAYGGYDPSLVPSNSYSSFQSAGMVDECNLSIREAMRNEGVDVDACFYGTPREKVSGLVQLHADSPVKQPPASCSTLYLHDQPQRVAEGKHSSNGNHTHDLDNEIDLLWGGEHESKQDQGLHQVSALVLNDAAKSLNESVEKSFTSSSTENMETTENIELSGQMKTTGSRDYRKDTDFAIESSTDPIFFNYQNFSQSCLESPLASPSKMPHLEFSSANGKEKENEKTWYSPHYLSGSAAAFTAFRRHKTEDASGKDIFSTPSVRRECKAADDVEVVPMASLETPRKNDTLAEAVDDEKHTMVLNESKEPTSSSTSIALLPNPPSTSSNLGLVHCIELLSDDDSDKKPGTHAGTSAYDGMNENITSLLPNPSLVLRDSSVRVSKSTLALASELVSQFASARTSSQLPISVSSLALLSELAARGIMEPKDQTLLSSLWPTTGVFVFVSFRFVINHINRRAQTWVTIFRVKDSRREETQSQSDDGSSQATKVRSTDIIKPALESPEMMCLRLRSMVMAVSPGIVEAAHEKAVKDVSLTDLSDSTGISAGPMASNRAAVHPAFTPFIRTFNGVGQVYLPHFSKLAFSLGGLTLTQSYKHDICFTRKAIIPPGTSLILPSDTILAQTTAALLKAYESNAIPVITKLQHCQFSPPLE